MIGQHGRPALEEVLARPSGDLVDSAWRWEPGIGPLPQRPASIHKTNWADAG